MKRRIALLGLAAASVLSFVACDKDDGPSLQELQLTAREWKVLDITQKSLVDPTVDSSIVEDCAGDDRLVFNMAKQFNFKDGTIHCDSVHFQYDIGTWSFASNATKIILEGSIRDQEWKILKLNDSLLNVEWLDSVSVTNKVVKQIYLKNK